MNNSTYKLKQLRAIANLEAWLSKTKNEDTRDEIEKIISFILESEAERNWLQEEVSRANRKATTCKGALTDIVNHLRDQGMSYQIEGDTTNEVKIDRALGVVERSGVVSVKKHLNQEK